MSFNGFQKNPFVNSSSANIAQNSYNNINSNFSKLGRKTVEQVKEEMIGVKFRNNLAERKTEVKPEPAPTKAPDYQSRVNNLRNINRQ